MQLIELIFQGFGEDPGLRKVPLRTGLNPVRNTTTLSDDLIRNIFLSLLFPTAASSGLNLTTGAKSRAGMTFLDSSNDTFRIVRDYNSKTISLSKLNPENNKFDEISKESSFIKEMFAASFKLSSRSHYQTLFTAGGEALQLQLQNHLSGNSGSNQASEYFGSLEAESTSQKNEIAKERLNKLKKELQSIDNLQQVEFELDEAQRSLFVIDEKLEKIKLAQEEYEKVRTDLQANVSPEINTEIPDNIDEKVAEYRQMEQRKSSDLNTLEQRANKFLNQFDQIRTTAIHKEPMFLTGLCGLPIMAGLALYLKSAQALPVIGIVVSIGLIAASFIMYMNRQDKRKVLQKQLDDLDHDKKAIEKKYDMEMAMVFHLMKRIGANHPDEILEILGEQNKVTKQLSDRKQAMENLKEELDESALHKERKRIQAECKSIEAKLRSFPAVSMDPNSLRKEISELESQMSFSNPQSQISTNTNSSHPLESLIAAAAESLKLDNTQLTELISKGLGVNLSTMTNRHFNLPVVESGKLTAVGKDSTTEPVSIYELNGTELVMVYFAIQFTILQIVAKKIRLPLFFAELPLAGDSEQFVYSKAAEHLGKNLQSIFISRNDLLLRPFADPIVI